MLHNAREHGNKCHDIKCLSDFSIDVLGDVVWVGTDRIRYISYEIMLEAATQEWEI
jgi:hypothetical protein